MQTRAFGLGLVIIVAAAVCAFAETFPLTFKTIPRKDMQRFPGGYGNYGQLRLQKPADLKREPKPVSRAPLYAQCSGSDSKNVIVRLDESQDGKGYDRLIVDLNRNGDLTDDPVASADRSENAGDQNRRLEFGPVQAPASMGICGGVPQVAAEAYVPNAQYLRSATDRADIYAGQVTLKAAWYLSTTAKVNGRTYLLGVYDGNGNLKLGDAPRYSTYRPQGAQENWYIGGGDSVLVDRDNSGGFQSDRLNSESLQFASLVYLDAVPYRLALSADRTALSLEKWSEPLVEVAIEPKGEQVRSVDLAWQHGKDEWEVLRPAVVNGKFKVPAGQYRLFTCTLVGEKSGRSPVMALAYDRLVRSMLRFETGNANTLRCGGPLDVKVTAEKRAPRPYENTAILGSGSDFVVAINANVVGNGGEGYSSYGTGKEFREQPLKPKFVIADVTGAKIADGNLEFG